MIRTQIVTISRVLSRGVHTKALEITWEQRGWQWRLLWRGLLGRSIRRWIGVGSFPLLHRGPHGWSCSTREGPKLTASEQCNVKRTRACQAWEWLLEGQQRASLPLPCGLYFNLRLRFSHPLRGFEIESDSQSHYVLTMWEVLWSSLSEKSRPHSFAMWEVLWSILNGFLALLAGNTVNFMNLLSGGRGGLTAAVNAQLFCTELQYLLQLCASAGEHRLWCQHAASPLSREDRARWRNQSGRKVCGCCSQLS